MKLQLLSDLHLESDPSFVPTPAPGADVLVLAGDVGSYQAGSRLGGRDYGLARFSPRNGWPTPVVYVPGNHEYDADDFDEVHARLQALCVSLDIHWLERETLILGDVRLIGTTLWSDFDALARPGDTLTEVLRKRGKAFRAANFYLEKMGTTRHGNPWMAEEIREHALLCQRWLREALSVSFHGTTVAITHFAPTLDSADPRYGVSPGTAGFCNALDALLAQADVWLHGHLHCAHDYLKSGCRVVANPLGYFGKGEQQEFDPLLCVDIPGKVRATIA